MCQEDNLFYFSPQEETLKCICVGARECLLFTANKRGTLEKIQDNMYGDDFVFDSEKKKSNMMGIIFDYLCRNITSKVI